MRHTASITSDFARLSEMAHEFSQTWFLDENGRDVFAIDGISYGLVPQIDVFLLIKDMLEQRKDTRQSMLSLDWFISSVKNRHMEWSIKERVSRLLKPVLKPSSPAADTSAIFIYDVWNHGSIRSLANVHATMSRDCTTAAICFEPRTYRLVRSLTRANTILYPNHFAGTVDSEGARTESMWHKQYDKHRLRLIEILRDFQEIPVESAIGRIDHLMKYFMSQMARDRARAIWFLDHVKPEAMAMASDCHKWSRLLALLARPRGIRTLVIQHGAPVARHAYVPVIADTMAVWGKASVDRLVSWGAPAEKLVMTGQPRFDSIPRLRESRNAHMNAKKHPKIVVATSPLTDVLDITFINVVREGLRDIERALDITLKLHPGESKEQFFRNLIRNDARTWCIERYSDTHKLIASADAVITTQSTVGIETLALGTPLIIVDLPGIPSAIPYCESGAAFVVRTANELNNALRDILSAGPIVSQRRLAGDRLAEEYLFKLDGRATDRVIALIAQGRIDE